MQESTTTPQSLQTRPLCLFDVECGRDDTACGRVWRAPSVYLIYLNNYRNLAMNSKGNNNHV